MLTKSLSLNDNNNNDSNNINQNDEYNQLVLDAFNSCIPYINELYPNVVKNISALGLLQKRTLIRTILTNITVIIDDETCMKIDKLLTFELSDTGTIDLDSISPFGKVKQTIVSVWKGSIVRLEVDAIVNAVSNPYCLGCNIPLHTCIDSHIHSSAGPRLKNEAKILSKTEWKTPLKVGECRPTKAHCLPCKHIIHTKGPICQEPTDTDKQNLINCYVNSLNLAKALRLRTIAFCCISSGIHCFQPYLASRIAIETVRTYLENNVNTFDSIVFAVSSSMEFKSYMNNQNIMLKKQPSEISRPVESTKKRMLLPLPALKGLHYPLIINDESDMDSSKDIDLDTSVDLHSLKLLTSIEGARDHFSNRTRDSTWKDIDDDELEMPDINRLNSLKLNTSLVDAANKERLSDAGSSSDSKSFMNDSMDAKYDWIHLTLTSGSKSQQAFLNDFAGNINDDTNIESSYLKKLSSIYNPDLSVMQYILGRTRLSKNLSSTWRCYKERKKFKMILAAIFVIQRAYKSYYVREKLIRFRIELRMLRHRAIVNIQSLWRRYICRQKFIKLYIEISIRVSVQKYAIVKISRVYRGYAAREKVSKHIYAIIALQSYYRMKLCRYYHQMIISLSMTNIIT